ncbi:MAG: hypothetical protein ACRECX_03615 [Methyloceanibacter sp.]|uniref:hypothetical protein n=1 Tax=Methyloceanibacter sp. TaxID=1965321 RepID=UPI003D6D9DFF
MALNLVNSRNLDDSDLPGLELDGAIAVTTFEFAGRHFFCVGGNADNGISVFEQDSDGNIINIENVDDADDPDFNLFALTSLTTIFVDGQPLVFATGFSDDGLSGFAALASGQLINVDNVADDATLELGNANAVISVNTAQNRDLIFVAASNDDGVSSFEVAADGTLINRDNVDDSDDGAFQLDGAIALATAQIGVGNSVTALFVAGIEDGGISVFTTTTGTLINQDNVTDAGNLELDGVAALATAVVGSKIYLFAAGLSDDGISVFEVGLGGDLTNVFNVTDDSTLNLGGAIAITATKIAGTEYVFVAGTGDNGISVFGVAADGTLINVDNIDDADEPDLELLGVRDLATAVVNGQTFLYAAGHFDDGISSFRVDVTGLTINGTGGNDTIDALNAPAAEFLPSELGDVISGLGGDDRLEGLGGDDVLTGGGGRDIQLGGADSDRFDSNAASETKKGSQRDKINHFQRGQDDIDLKDIDARTGVSGNNKFRFIGKDEFSEAKGELRYEDKGSKVIVQGDRNGDGEADFEIFVKVGSLAKGDFLL